MSTGVEFVLDVFERVTVDPVGKKTKHMVKNANG